MDKQWDKITPAWEERIAHETFCFIAFDIQGLCIGLEIFQKGGHFPSVVCDHKTDNPV
jgi:hypothetical protein